MVIKSIDRPSLGIRISRRIKAIIFSSQGFPLLLTFSVIGMLFVLFRMKGVELDYEMINVNRDLNKVLLENKTLRAQKAEELSVKRLRSLAQKYDLNQPKQEQIIVIP